MTLGFPDHLSRRWQWLALVVGGAVLLFAAYGQVLTRGPFGINDDYQFLYRVQAGIFNPAHNEIVGMGRPLDSWSYELAYGLCAGKVASLVWLRAVSLAGLGLFAWTLFRTLGSLRYAPGFAATVAALVVLTPACGVYAAYGSGFAVPLTLTAALLAGRLLAGPGGWRHDLGATLLIVAVCCTWQAAVPLAMFPTLADAWRRTEADGEPPPGACVRPWWRPWLVGGVAVLIYGFLFWLAVRLGSLSSGTERLAVATDPLAKARFLGGLLRGGLTSWARLQEGPWEWIVGALSLGACLFALAGWREGRLHPPTAGRRAGLAFVMIMLSVAPLLAAREDNGSFRVLIVLYIVLIFLGVGGMGQLLRRWPAAVRVALSLTVVAACAGAARYRVWHGLIAPSIREYVGLRELVRTQFPGGRPARLVYLLPPPDLLAPGREPSAWEYGLVSTSFWWVTKPFLVLIFEETAPHRAEAADLTISYREAGHPGVPVLDPFPVLLREPGAWRDDPRWGRVRAFGGGWTYSHWFGYFNPGKFPLIQHHLLGWFVFASQAQDGKDLWFYNDSLDLFFAGPDTYPFLFLGRQKRWVVVSDDNPAQAFLDDPVTGQRVPYLR